jgi:hypothetical protein
VYHLLPNILIFTSLFLKFERLPSQLQQGHVTVLQLGPNIWLENLVPSAFFSLVCNLSIFFNRQILFATNVVNSRCCEISFQKYLFSAGVHTTFYDFLWHYLKFYCLKLQVSPNLTNSASQTQTLPWILFPTPRP